MTLAAAQDVAIEESAVIRVVTDGRQALPERLCPRGIEVQAYFIGYTGAVSSGSLFKIYVTSWTEPEFLLRSCSIQKDTVFEAVCIH